jgi:S-DNA-T family DNA segregation ATPase FtsK/SpoIIIE
VREQVRRTGAAQQAASAWVHPPPGALLSAARSARVWERRPDDPDFLQLRIGEGPREVATRGRRKGPGRAPTRCAWRRSASCSSQPARSTRP